VPYHVSSEEFERIAAAALDRVPAPLRERMDADNLLITIQAGATVHDRANDIDEHVLGFYEGGEDSVFSAYTYPKRIVLLQGNIERWCASYDELVEQVHDTVLHEVAHYFGLSHADIEQTRLRH
jgi:predicted Zn-dependent protease with MMP-like domain